MLESFCILLQYSDLAESERTKVLEKFRQLTAECNQTFDDLSEGIEGGQEESKCHVLVLTDICLPLVNSGELPLAARVLINWELPAKKVNLHVFCLFWSFQHNDEQLNYQLEIFFLTKETFFNFFCI